MKRFFGILLAIAAGMAHAAGPVIDVNVSGVLRQSLSMAEVRGEGSAGQAFVSTLRNDLLRCGWYRLTEGRGQVSVGARRRHARAGPPPRP